jgi:hypothetical protein
MRVHVTRLLTQPGADEILHFSSVSDRETHDMPHIRT